MEQEQQKTEAQRRVIGVLSHAPAKDVSGCFSGLPELPQWHFLRRPETGLVMVRGRMGAEGGAFNFGEVTVTRCVIVLATGETGFAYALGRDKNKSTQSAIIHALWKCAGYTELVEQTVLQPLARAQCEADAKTRSEVAPTKVDFFTLMRGDD